MKPLEDLLDDIPSRLWVLSSDGRLATIEKGDDIWLICFESYPVAKVMCSILSESGTKTVVERITFDDARQTAKSRDDCNGIRVGNKYHWVR